jgi:hypothetical protein
MLRAAGVLLAVLLLLMEYGFVQFWSRLAERGEEIERTLTLPAPAPGGIPPAPPAGQILQAMTAGVFWAGPLSDQLSRDITVVTANAVAAAPALARDPQWQLQLAALDGSADTYTIVLTNRHRQPPWTEGPGVHR